MAIAIAHATETRLIDTERAKITATAFNNTAVAAFVIGVVSWSRSPGREEDRRSGVERGRLLPADHLNPPVVLWASRSR